MPLRRSRMHAVQLVRQIDDLRRNWCVVCRNRPRPERSQNCHRKNMHPHFQPFQLVNGQQRKLVYRTQERRTLTSGVIILVGADPRFGRRTPTRCPGSKQRRIRSGRRLAQSPASPSPSARQATPQNCRSRQTRLGRPLGLGRRTAIRRRP